MSPSDQPKSKRHYFELPEGINKMSEAEIATLAAELSKRIMSVMPATVKKDEEGGRK